MRFKCDGERERERNEAGSLPWRGGAERVAALTGIVRTCSLGIPAFNLSADVVSSLPNVGRSVYVVVEGG